MTRDEALKGLKVMREDFSGYKPNEEMFDMAIKALEQEPCEDAVSRKAVDQNIYDYAESNGLSYANMKNAILDVPSVTPAHVTCKDCCNVNCAYHAQMCDPEEYRPNFYCTDAIRRG